MSLCRVKPSIDLPFRVMIRIILTHFIIDIQRERSISSNNKIDYTSIGNVKMKIKYEEVRDDWDNDEEEDETNDIDIKQVEKYVIEKSKEMKKII